MSLTKTMGNADHIIRTILAILFGTLYYTSVTLGTLGIGLIVLGVIFLLTSFISVCPLYVPFGIRTCKTEQA